MNTSLDSLEVLLTRLEADPSASLSARERAALFAQAAHVYASREEVSGAQRAEWEAKLFSSAQWHSSFKDQEPYADCSTWATPDAIAYFAARLAQTANPFHAARYADFLWEKSAQGRQKFDYGRRAVAAHLTCVEIYAQAQEERRREWRGQPWPDGHYSPQISDAAQRAWRLACQLTEAELIDEVKALLFGTIARMEQWANYQWCTGLVAALTRTSGRPTRQIASTDWESLLHTVDRALTFLATCIDERPGQALLYFEFQRTYHRLRVDVLRAGGYPEADRRTAQCAIAVLYEAQATYAVAHGWQQCAVADFLAKALDIYQQMGDVSRGDALKLRIKDARRAARGEMRTFDMTDTVAVDDLNRAFAQLQRDLSPERALVALATHLLPHVGVVRHEVDGRIAESPITSLFSYAAVDNDNLEATARTSAEIAAMHTAQLTAHLLQFGAQYFFYAVPHLRTAHGLKADGLARALARSPWVEPRNRVFIQRGLRRYYAGDYISALHVLIPQLEDVIRHMLPALGVATTSSEQGVEREKPLEVVFDRDRERARLRQALGEDLWYTLRVALIDKWGWNLRNQIAHGLVSEEECNEVRAAAIVLLLLNVTHVELTQASATPEAATSVEEQGHE
jgi:hypothetical protein